ncbi:hypothetical protein DAEQUDRAFT_761214 [Daedalea quercina L-15889]|uniref:Uncharacterized protein n=1 Tax=Daedalea quercina L-15889 TaxID=1314783 RepID=A0A165U3H9_9APHY|nr:hypothetical protein DAEQUDRAFT_761214 [Daedalea quercina L-15889]
MQIPAVLSGIQQGVKMQCLRAEKCKKAMLQYHANVCLNADDIHPPPGAGARPSFTANVNSDTAKYLAGRRAQTSRQELIEDLESMSQRMLDHYMGYRTRVEKKTNVAPTRIIFYRGACNKLQISPKNTMIVVGKHHRIRFFP